MDRAQDSAESAERGAAPVRQSSRQHRTEVEAYALLATTLVGLAPHKLEDVPLEPEVRREVIACRPFRKNAKIRQLRRIATLLRRVDFDELKAAIEDAAVGSSTRRRWDRECERWRQRLLEDGDVALNDFITDHPEVDRQQVRQLVRAAHRDPTSGKSKLATRALLKAIRAATKTTLPTMVTDAVRTSDAADAAANADEAEPDEDPAEPDEDPAEPNENPTEPDEDPAEPDEDPAEANDPL